MVAAWRAAGSSLGIRAVRRCGLHRSRQELVLHYSPGAAGADDTWLVESESLAEWLESWMDGTPWQRSGAHSSRTFDGPILWEALAARLGTAD